VNSDEARCVLRRLASLVKGHPYGDVKVEAWANALCDVDQADALRAVTELANGGKAEIGIPEIRGFLRDERAAQRRSGQARMSVEVCGCTTYTMCDRHRAIGLAALKQLRVQERPAQRRWSFANRNVGPDPATRNKGEGSAQSGLV
jgi:hypothetical protein